MPRIAPMGDAALTVTFASDVSDPARRRVLGAARTIERRRVPGVLELVPALAALTIHYDPFEIDYTTLREEIARLLANDTAASGTLPTGSLVRIAVRYDGPDLDHVAEQVGLNKSEVIARHAAVEYDVLLLGFVPGWAYLGPLDPALVLPRRATPRPKVPAGSVAIAGTQTGIYPAGTPGGWHLIGRTDARMFDPSRSPPTLLQVGDRVRFIPEPR